MSAVYSVRWDDCIQIITDGATYDGQMRLREVGEKISRSPDYPIAVASRGNADLGAFVRERIIGLAKLAGGFDEAMVQMPEFIDVMRETLPTLGVADTYVEVLIAGWSADCGFRQFIFKTASIAGDEDFVLIEIPNEIAMGPTIDQADLIRWLTANGGSVDEIKAKLAGKRSNLFAVYGPEIADYWRRQQAPAPNSRDKVFLIGGHCDLTTITPEGVSTCRLRTWPDKIGARIDPYRGVNVTPIASGLNRKQRLAAGHQRHG